MIVFLIFILSVVGFSEERVDCEDAAAKCEIICDCGFCTSCLACIAATVPDCCEYLFPEQNCERKENAIINMSVLFRNQTESCICLYHGSQYTCGAVIYPWGRCTK